MGFDLRQWGSIADALSSHTPSSLCASVYGQHPIQTPATLCSHKVKWASTETPLSWVTLDHGVSWPLAGLFIEKSHRITVFVNKVTSELRPWTMGKLRAKQWSSKRSLRTEIIVRAESGRQAQVCFSVDFPVASELLSWKIYLSLIIIWFMSVFPTWEAKETKN